MKKQLIILLFVLFYSNLQAQEGVHYLYLNLGGGSHNLSYDLKNGSEKGSFGYSFNAGYGYFLNKHWGLQTGFGLQSFRPSATLNYSTTAPSIDDDGEAYEFQTFYNDWREQQQILFLEIPMGLQYRHELTPKIRLLGTVGLKMAIPVKTTYKSTGGAIVTKGSYSQYNVVLEDLPRHGLVNITDPLIGDISFKTAYSAFADIGALYGLPNNMDLYAGGYVAYGLNNIAQSHDKLVYEQDGTYNGVFGSSQTDKAKTVAIGLKVGILWRFGKNKEVYETVNQE